MEHVHLCHTSEYCKRILLPLAYSLVFVMGLGLNATLLWSVCSRRAAGTARQSTNLAVTDLLYILSLPPLISNDMGGAWPFGNIICKAARFLFMSNLHCSIILMCVSVYCFLGVCFPIAALHLRTKKLSVLASVLVWALVATEIVPTLVFAQTGFTNRTVCFEMTDPRQIDVYFPYGIFITVVGFLLPFLVVIICYSFMQAGDNITIVRTRNMRNKSLRTLVMVLLMFVLCFVPYHVARTVYLFVRVYMVNDCHVLNVAMISVKVWKPLVSFNCCVNPLYFLCTDRYLERN